MGKKLLFVFLVAFAFNANAQNNIEIKDTSGAVVNADTVTFIEYYRGVGSNPKISWDHKKFVTVTNTTTDTMVLTLSRSEQQIIAGSYDFYCYGQTCLGPVKAGDQPFRTSSTDTVRVDPGGVAAGDSPFTVYIDSARSGVAVYRYEFSDKRNRQNNAYFYIKWDIRNVTSIDDVQLASKFSIYPNPAETSANVRFENAMSFNRQEIQVFNILGEQVLTQVLSKGVTTANVNVEGLTKGIYFLNIVADGAKLGSKKLIVR